MLTKTNLFDQKSCNFWRFLPKNKNCIIITHSHVVLMLNKKYDILKNFDEPNVLVPIDFP